MKYNFLIFITFSLLLLSCQSENEIFVSIVRSDHFPEFTYDFESNPITKKRFELGKMLFNDPRLSIDNSVACSNCHVKGVAFTDPQHNPSVGINNSVGTRNAPMIANMAFQNEFLWDGGVTHLDFVSVFAIENEKEMGETIDVVVKKLRQIEEYQLSFQDVYSKLDSITSPYMLRAISDYLAVLISDQSKYDKVVRGELSFTTEEMEGKLIFDAKCASCHSGALFTNKEFMNNGLDTAFEDIGRSLISETDDDLGKFKVPSLRNITLTAPYMHDGRFKDLDQVLDHYSENVKWSSTLAEELQDGTQLGIQLTIEEKERLKTFLETLTDYEFISNPMF